MGEDDGRRDGRGGGDDSGHHRQPDVFDEPAGDGVGSGPSGRVGEPCDNLGEELHGRPLTVPTG